MGRLSGAGSGGNIPITGSCSISHWDLLRWGREEDINCFIIYEVFNLAVLFVVLLWMHDVIEGRMDGEIPERRKRKRRKEKVLMDRCIVIMPEDSSIMELSS